MRLHFAWDAKGNVVYSSSTCRWRRCDPLLRVAHFTCSTVGSPSTAFRGCVRCHHTAILNDSSRIVEEAKRASYCCSPKERNRRKRRAPQDPSQNSSWRHWLSSFPLSLIHTRRVSLPNFGANMLDTMCSQSIDCTVSTVQYAVRY